MKVLNAWWPYDSPDIFVKEQQGDRVVTRTVRAELVSFLRMVDVNRDLMRQLRNSRAVIGLQTEGDWLRITWKREQMRRAACDSEQGWFKSQDIPCFEWDVNPVRRWLSDAPDIEIARPRRCYIDLETCARYPLAEKERHRILSWALVDDTGAKHLGMLDEDTDQDEARLLRELWTLLQRYDQVAAWNGDYFDFPVLQARTKLAKLQVDPKHWLWIDHLELYRRMNTASESGDEKQSMELQSVAMAVLGEGKLEGFPGREMFANWAKGGDTRQRLGEYNLKDADLMRRIEEKTGFLELLFTLSQVCRTFPDSRGTSPMEQVESYMMRLGAMRGHHWPGRNHQVKREGYGFAGAFVLEPRGRGIQRNVHVCDFSGMYPSIIQSLNISPETVREQASIFSTLPVYMQQRRGEKVQAPLDVAVAPGTGVWFEQDKRGLLPEALDDLIGLRKSWAAKKDAAPPGTPEWVEADRRSTAYKVAANSFFGVMGAELSRLYTREVAESITLAGVALIRATLTAAEQQGLAVVYGDTDSLFVKGCTQERFASFVAWCNTDLYPQLLRRWGATRNKVKLAYEKAFDRVVFVSAKRYVGRYVHYKGKAANEHSKPEIKGLEFKRGDSLRLTRQMQAEVADAMLGGGVLRLRVEECEDAPGYFQELVERWRRRILEGELDLADVRQSKRLSKPIKEYLGAVRKDGKDASVPAHVRVAQVLQERGQDVQEGARIEYIVLDGSQSPQLVIPAEDWTGECDRFHLWESGVWPPTERLLLAAFPEIDWGAYTKARPRRGSAGAGQVSLAGVTIQSRRRKAQVDAPAAGTKATAESTGQRALFSLDDARPRHE